MLLPTLLCLLAVPQVDEPASSPSFDRIVELELEFPAVELLRYEYESEFEGTLHVWTSCETALVLGIEGRERDRASYLRQEVETGEQLVFLVELATGAERGAADFTLHLVASPETEATREAARVGAEANRSATLSLEQGDPSSARETARLAIANLQVTPGAEDSQLVTDILCELGQVSYSANGSSSSFDAMTFVLDHRARTLPENHVELTYVRQNLATSMSVRGDLDGARLLHEVVLESCELTLPADHPDLLAARMNVAHSMHLMGEVRGANALYKSVLAGYERTLPPDDTEILRARLNRSIAMGQLGNRDESRTLRESVLESYEKTLRDDQASLLSARLSVVNSLEELGDLAGGRRLRESVLGSYDEAFPPDYPDLLSARQGLAHSMLLTGDLYGARALYDSVLGAYGRTLAPDHPTLLATRSDLANTMLLMGDLAGARGIHASVLELYEDTLPVDHPRILSARTDLAGTLWRMGDAAGSRTLYESAAAGYERTRHSDHALALHAYMGLANSMYQLGDWFGGRAANEAALIAGERGLPADHPSLLRVRLGLATSMAHTGDRAGARAIEESVLVAYERTLPADHPELLYARSSLASSRFEAGDLAGSLELLPAQCAGMNARILDSLALAPRQVSRLVIDEGNRLSMLSFLAERGELADRYSLFDLSETMRLAACEAPRSFGRYAADLTLAPLLAAGETVRRQRGVLVADSFRFVEDSEAFGVVLTQLSVKRDRLEKDATRLLAASGVYTRPIHYASLADRLYPGEAAVGYRRMPGWFVDDRTGSFAPGLDHLYASLLLADATLINFDLGPAIEFEELARAWRIALGAPVRNAFGGGLVLETATGVHEARLGARLRERLLDPLLAAAGEDLSRLYVCADDVVSLLPLDALPFGSKGKLRLGDKVEIVNEVSFARLMFDVRPFTGAPSLLNFGGVDYYADALGVPGSLATAAPIGLSGSAFGGASNNSSFQFQDLPGAQGEVESIAGLFQSTFRVEPNLLTRRKTNKAALFETAIGKRFVHITTRSWFAPENVRSQADALPFDSTLTSLTLSESTGFAPMALSGLALAGANHGANSLGRVDGILTAEELSTLDLSYCDLAVLSACEPNVGLRRAAQGIQSLQSALYAAGARTSITSLWKGDDGAARYLMECFYENLWVEHMSKAEALWSAKRKLRDEGLPPFTWAGWVLTGDPR